MRLAPASQPMTVTPSHTRTPSPVETVNGTVKTVKAPEWNIRWLASSQSSCPSCNSFTTPWWPIRHLYHTNLLQSLQLNLQQVPQNYLRLTISHSQCPNTSTWLSCGSSQSLSSPLCLSLPYCALLVTSHMRRRPMAVPFSSGKAKVVTTLVNPSLLHYSQALNTHPRKSITLRYLDKVVSGAVLISNLELMTWLTTCLRQPTGWWPVTKLSRFSWLIISISSSITPTLCLVCALVTSLCTIQPSLCTIQLLNA